MRSARLLAFSIVLRCAPAMGAPFAQADAEALSTSLATPPSTEVHAEPTAGWRDQYRAGAVTVTYGSEGARISPIPRPLAGDHSAVVAPAWAGATHAHVGYVDARIALRGAIDLELGLFHHAWEDGDDSRRRTEPRIAIAWRPFSGHLLRAVSRTDMELPLLGTTPADALGLLALRTPQADGGVTRTLQGRWDAEWGGGFATALQFEQRRLDRFAIELEQHPALEAEVGRIERLGLTGTLALSAAARLIAHYERQTSEDLSLGATHGTPLPLLPDRELGLELAWEATSRQRYALGAEWIGARAVPLSGAALPPYATTYLTWRRVLPQHGLSVLAAARNLLDERYDSAPGLAGPGREFLIGTEVKF